MFTGPMNDVWEMVNVLEGDFDVLLTTLGAILVSAAGIYGLYLAWRKYRMAMNKI